MYKKVIKHFAMFSSVGCNTVFARSLYCRSPLVSFCLSCPFSVVGMRARPLAGCWELGHRRSEQGSVP